METTLKRTASYRHVPYWSTEPNRNTESFSDLYRAAYQELWDTPRRELLSLKNRLMTEAQAQGHRYEPSVWARAFAAGDVYMRRYKSVPHHV